MRILFLTHVLPYPLDAGPKIRSYYVLRYLCQNHDVTLLSFVRSQDEPKNIEHIKSFCSRVETVPIRRSRLSDSWHLVRSMTGGLPFLIGRDHVRLMSEKVTEMIAGADFEAVHADQLAMAQYASDHQHLERTLDEHNAVWTIVRRMSQHERRLPVKWLEDLEWRKLRRYEATTVRSFDHVITVTEQDRRTLQEDTGSAVSFTVIPICIDASRIKRAQVRQTAKDIICIGGMFYPPNVDGMVWFANEVLPLIRRERPDTNLVIVGSRPDSKLLKLSRAKSGVRVAGYVSDLEPYLSSSAVFVVPLRAGSGMRVKILDAWARGIPIVSTNIGCEGIQVKSGENILLADNSADFAKSVLRILDEPSLGSLLSENGRRWVEQHYDWRVVYRALDDIYPK